jgi:hypothetical protein
MTVASKISRLNAIGSGLGFGFEITGSTQSRPKITTAHIGEELLLRLWEDVVSGHPTVSLSSDSIREFCSRDEHVDLVRTGRATRLPLIHVDLGAEINVSPGAAKGSFLVQRFPVLVFEHPRTKTDVDNIMSACSDTVLYAFGGRRILRSLVSVYGSTPLRPTAPKFDTTAFDYAMAAVRGEVPTTPVVFRVVSEEITL